ncbi:MAG: glycosyltransferase family 2 protein [Nitrososphaerales archaeon]
MHDNSICAVIVTFQPSQDVLENFIKIRAQVEDLVVVDNGSSEYALDWLVVASHKMNFTLIRNGDNLGIATGMNIGIRWAESNGHDYAILFDQDSSVTEGFMDSMVQFYNDCPHREKVAILVPRYVDRRYGNILPSRYADDGTLQIAMCSGSLMPVSVFRRYGMFEDDFFIDYVDYEYCLRVRSAGGLIEECKDAVLMHAPGNPKTYYLGGIPLITTANYSAIRRYYLERNMIVTVAKYWKRYPTLCCSMFLNSVKDCVKVILIEDRKWSKVCSSLRGLYDGFHRRIGKSSRF